MTRSTVGFAGFQNRESRGWRATPVDTKVCINTSPGLGYPAGWDFFHFKKIE